jgi:chemosensory pili system protein ChpC
MLKHSEIRGVLIPLQQSQLLLPNACIAEVISYEDPETIDDAETEMPEWYRGMLDWRTLRIPVVSLEPLLDMDISYKQGHRSRIIVCNLPGGNDDMPYAGIVADSIPRLARISEAVITATEHEIESLPLVFATVNINDTDAFIPDLSFIETQLQLLK